jgi:integrase
VRGHIHKRVKKGADGKPKTYWYVVVDIGIDEDGKRRQKWHGSYRTRREADQASVTILRELEQRTYVEPRKLTLTDYVRDEWLPQIKQQVKASTFDSYSRNLALHVLPILGGRQLQAITAGHLNALYRQLLESGRLNGPKGRGLAPKTVRNVHTTLSKVFADAIDQELVSRNPAARAKPPKPPRGTSSMRFWTPDELARFLDYVSTHRWHALWRLAAMTGMRRGELLGLRWGDVDFRHSRLAVRQTLISIAYQPSVSTPKSHGSRVIDLDAETLAVLRALWEEHRRQHADLVFLTDEGEPIHPESVRVVFERLPAHAGVQRIRFHDLRHTHATIALRAGVPVKVISERLGHASPAFTLQQYAHVIPGMQAEAAQQVADLVAARRCATCNADLPADSDGSCDACGAAAG